MRRRFALDLGILILANLLVKPLWILGIDRAVQNATGPETYGNYFALFNFSFLFSVVVDAGLNNFNNRAISRHPRRAADYLLNLGILKWGLALIFIALSMLAGKVIGFSNEQLHLLFWICIIQALGSILLFNRSGISGLGHFRTDAMISVSDRLAGVLLCGILLLLIRPFTIGWFVFSQIAALSLATLASSIILWTKTKSGGRLWKSGMFRRVAQMVIPFTTLHLLMTAYYRLDGVMLERLLGTEGAKQAGIYAASYRLLDAINMIAFLFSTLLLPTFSSMIKRKEDPSLLGNTNVALLLSGSSAIAALCMNDGAFIMRLLYVNAEESWIHTFVLLMFSFIPIASTYVFGTLLTARGDMKSLNLISLAGLVLNFTLNFILIPGKLASGAALATLITQIFVAAALIAVNVSKHRYKINPSVLLNPILSFASSLLFSLIAHIFLNPGAALLTAGMLSLLTVLSLNSGFFKLMLLDKNTKS
jgi:O-antigen/teichoic acid export membrane protein